MIRTLASASAALTSLGLATVVEAMPPASAWEIGPNIRGRNYSVGMPAQPSQGANGSVVIDFPVSSRGQVEALSTEVNSLEGVRQITLRYRIDAARGARFIAGETPSETATISIYLQQAGDNWSARGRYTSYRWYAPASGVIPLIPGEHAVTLRLDDRWTNVLGEPNSAVPHQYAEALANASTIGIAFGSSSRRSHGVFATAPARFTLIALDIE